MDVWTCGGGVMVGWWRWGGGVVEVWWRCGGGVVEVWTCGGRVVEVWRCGGGVEDLVRCADSEVAEVWLNCGCMQRSGRCFAVGLLLLGYTTTTTCVAVGLNVDSLLHLRLHPQQRLSLLEQFLSLPVRSTAISTATSTAISTAISMATSTAISTAISMAIRIVISKFATS